MTDKNTLAAAVKAFSVAAPTFDIYFPLPYRISAAILVGVWCWGLNVKILTNSHIDVGLLVKYSFSKGAGELDRPRPRHQGVYQFATGLTICVLTSWSLFSLMLGIVYRGISSAPGGLLAIDLLPITTLIIVLGAFVFPGRQFHSAGRRRFREIFARILTGNLDIDCRFADILVADALTSYSRVLLDLAVAACMLISGTSSVGVPDRTRWSGPLMMLVVLSAPSLIRFRQCAIDFQRTGSKIHLANCAKYASAIPVVVLSAIQRVYKDTSETTGAISAEGLHKMWLFASLVNSVYSFIWDVSQDWGLELMSSPHRYTSAGLRSVLALKPANIYYLAIIVDFGLRMLWTMKLTTNWAGFGDYESGLFVLELLEIFRRGMWVAFRVEKEWVFTSKDHEGLPMSDMNEFHRRVATS